MICWGITDGSAGMAAQVRALAAALAIKPEMKKIVIRQPWARLPNVCYASPLRSLVIPHLLGPASDPLTPPYPQLVISCGRRAAIAAMGLKAHIHSGKSYFIHIQDPQVSAANFDLVVAMEHDRITASNVIKTRFALHSITPAALKEASQRFAPLFVAYPRPLVAVLLGGSTNKYTLTEAGMAHIITTLQRLLDHTPCSLLITPSRRTGVGNMALLRQAFAENRHAYLYDGGKENPYMGMLALADTIVASNDSVNMMSDAAATGKPLYIMLLPGHGDTKPSRFADMLMKNGIARPLGDKLEKWDYTIDDEMGRLAAEIRKRIIA